MSSGGQTTPGKNLRLTATLVVLMQWFSASADCPQEHCGISWALLYHMTWGVCVCNVGGSHACCNDHKAKDWLQWTIYVRYETTIYAIYELNLWLISHKWIVACLEFTQNFQEMQQYFALFKFFHELVNTLENHIPIKNGPHTFLWPTAYPVLVCKLQAVAPDFFV